ncbi:hypothetical protein [Flavobacterium sp. NKUCC04_CG]|nr:hypothetical protein [Flavobacterium sp. NKUCC04_CG]
MVELNYLDLTYTIGKLHLNSMPDLFNYSKGIQVIAWNRELV